MTVVEFVMVVSCAFDKDSECKGWRRGGIGIGVGELQVDSSKSGRMRVRARARLSGHGKGVACFVDDNNMGHTA